MSIIHQASIAAAVIALLGAPAESDATLVSGGLGPLSGLPDGYRIAALSLDPPGPSPLQLAPGLALDPGGIAGSPMSTINWSADVMGPGAMQHALGATTLGKLHGNADLLLWNLCAVVRTQQDHHHYFERIEAGATTQKLSEDIAKVSAVPLPGALWLFVIGVLGLAGSRITGMKRDDRTATAGYAAALHT
jgi:hypothetical protein